MIRNTFCAAGMAVSLGLAAPSSAALIQLTVSSGGIDAARTCSAASCANSSVIWSLDSGEQYAATGTVDIDTGTNQMVISLAVATSVIDADVTAPQNQAPLDDVNASSLVFTGGTYDATVSFVASAGPNGSTVYDIGPAQSGALVFTNVAATGEGNGPLSLGSVGLTGSCLIQADGTGSCGFTFGSAGTTPFQIPNFGNYDRWVRQTFNVGVVPEPGTLALLGLGLVCLARVGRARLP